MQILIGRLNRSRPIKDFNVCCSSGDPDDYDAECGSSSSFLLFAQKAKEKKCQGPVSRESSVVCNESNIDHQILRFLFFRGLRMKIHLSGICAFMVDF